MSASSYYVVLNEYTAMLFWGVTQLRVISIVTTITENLTEIGQLKSVVKSRMDVHFPLQKWRPTPQQPLPAVKMVKKCQLWSNDVYADLWARLRRSAPKLEVTWSGCYVTFNTKDKTAPTIAGSMATVVEASQEPNAAQSSTSLVCLSLLSATASNCLFAFHGHIGNYSLVFCYVAYGSNEPI